MLNLIWPCMIVISIFYSFFSGNINDLNKSIYDSSKSAIDLFIVLAGSMILWSGIMKIICETKIIKKITNIFNPIINILFPDLRENKRIRDLICMNMVSNFLGLGNASTPLGLRAIKELDKENNNKKNMSESMETLILINTASIQLIPTTIFSIRNSLGSSNPSKIIIPVWLSTIIAAIVGISILKILLRKNRWINGFDNKTFKLLCSIFFIINNVYWN